MASKTAPVAKLKRISAGIQPKTWKKAKELAKEAGVSLMQYVSDAVERRVRDVERKWGVQTPVLK